MDTKPTAELRRIRQWAKEKIDTGSEPPWAWFQYMKLIEVADTILAGMAVTTTENSQQLAERPERRLQLVASKSPQDTSQHRPDTSKTRMPM